MKFRSTRHANRQLMVEMAPMIDVVFLLIIFFMTTAQFAQITRADLELPEERGEQTETPDEAGIVINVSADGSIIVAERTVDMTELRSVIESELALRDNSESDIKILIRADRTAPAASLNRIVTMLRDLGIGSTRFATDPPG